MANKSFLYVTLTLLRSTLKFRNKFLFVKWFVKHISWLSDIIYVRTFPLGYSKQQKTTKKSIYNIDH